MSPTYRLECRGDVREVYVVEADSADEAVAMFERGDVPAPVVSEASTAVESVELDDPDPDD